MVGLEKSKEKVIEKKRNTIEVVLGEALGSHNMED